MCLVFWCIFEYSLDRDFTEIKFRKFHETPDDIYPSLTICDNAPFESTPAKERYKSHMKKLPLNIKGEKDILTEPLPIAAYMKLLEGKKEHLQNNNLLRLNNTYEELLLGLQEMDYDEVTTGLRDLISELQITFRIQSRTLMYLEYHVNNDDSVTLDETGFKDKNFKEETGSTETFWRKQLLEFKNIKSYISTRLPFYKCYTLDVPMKERFPIREISFSVNTSIFSYGLSTGQFHFYLTYPKQFLRILGQPGNRISLPKQPNQCYNLEIRLGPTKVVRRRDKWAEPCNEDWKNHDENQLNAISGRVGCNPRHWQIPSTLPNCSTPEQYKDLMNDLYKNDDEIFMPPCRSIETISNEKVATKPRWFACSRTTWLKLRIFLDQQSYYEELSFLRAYSFQSLIGNSGTITGVKYHNYFFV